MKSETKKAQLIADIGNAQVYHFQTMTDIMFKVEPTEVYWNYKNSNTPYGPFPSVYAAVEDWKRAEEERLRPTPNNLIQVDFVRKQRINCPVVK